MFKCMVLEGGGWKPFLRLVAIELAGVHRPMGSEHRHHVPMAARRTFSALGTIAIEPTTPVEDIVNLLNIQILVKLDHSVAVRGSF